MGAKAAAKSGKGQNSPMGFLACGLLGKICNNPALIYEACAEIEGKKFNKRNWKLVSSASKNKGRKKKKSKKNQSHSTYDDYAQDGSRKRTELLGLYSLFPRDFVNSYCDAKHSSKMQFTFNLLLGLNPKKGKCTGDKTVIVSAYGETLDVLALTLEKHSIPCLRLDGSIPTKKRGPIVDAFNDKDSEYLVLLLSNKAGGCGLNLIGANRLIMFDADWNPANDAQAMARVWRSGQKKPTYIYRLFSTGTLEEKIFQRQTFKSDLAQQLVAADEDMTDMTEFVRKDLKKIFMYNKETTCDTMERTNNKGYPDWNKSKHATNVGDVYLTRAVRNANMSYLFSKIVNDPRKKKEDEEEKREKRESVNSNASSIDFKKMKKRKSYED